MQYIRVAGYLAVLFFMCGASPEVSGIVVQPLDFQEETLSETFIQHIEQLESDGRHIYIRSENPYIIKIDNEGRYLGKVADIGFGPYLGKHIAAFALGPEFVAVTDRKNSVFFFRENALETYFSSSDYKSLYSFPFHNANSFGFYDNQLILPALPESEAMAVLHRLDGSVQRRLGKRQSQGLPDHLELHAFNAAFWIKGGDFWYCVFKFRPWVHQYDLDFNIKKKFEIQGEEVNLCEAHLFDESERGENPEIVPHFSDVKYFRGRLFVMCRGVLYDVDPDSGGTVQRYHFFGQGSDFEEVPPGERLTFFNFAFLETGDLVLSHPALLWNHDLWRADLKLNF